MGEVECAVAAMVTAAEGRGGRIIYELIAIIAEQLTQYANQTQVNHLRTHFCKLCN